MATVSKSEKKANRRDRKAAAAPNVLSMLQGRAAPVTVVADDEPDSQEALVLPTSVVRAAKVETVAVAEVDEFAEKPTLEASAFAVSSGVDAARAAETPIEFMAATDSVIEGLEAAARVVQDVIDFEARLKAHQAEVELLLSAPPGKLAEFEAARAAADQLHRDELQAGVPVQRPVVVVEAAPPAFSTPAPQALEGPETTLPAGPAPMPVEERVAAQPPAAAATVVRGPGRIKRLAAWTGRLVSRVDWVALAILLTIPLMVGAAFAFGALTVTVTLVSTLCVAAVVLLAVGQLQAHKGWQLKKVLFRVGVLVGVAALLFFTTGQHWQLVVAGMVFYLFGSRLLRK